MPAQSKFKGRLIGFLMQLVGGPARTINSQSIIPIEVDSNGDFTRCKGTVVITDGGAGYAKGCFYTKTNGSAGSTFYVNEGSNSSCDFNVVESAASSVTAVTAGAGLTGGGTEGAVSVAVGAGTGIDVNADDVAINENYLRYAEVALTNAEMLALRAAPKTLVAAPGAGKMIQFISAVLLFDYTGAYTESDDNMAVRYTNGSGVIVSDTIESTGFVDATADTATFARAKVDGIVAKTGSENQALVLHNTGDGEFGGGNAANAVRVKVAYRIVPTGF